MIMPASQLGPSDVFDAYGVPGRDEQATYVIRPDRNIAWRNRGIDVDGCRAVLDWFTGHKRRARQAVWLTFAANPGCEAEVEAFLRDCDAGIGDEPGTTTFFMLALSEGC
ncbi:hypothetical protein BHAOGJBA_5957 [Methylobacterium hispanicum]|uniref:Uncharacterized protein n=1 Tax=Methylobacterium hispanicum TaxID=270350 RepID=A0AAV4ZXI9_9HYPH|nr:MULTISPECIES: hypothetical protein [Methylobacterium]GJD92403.1 hypothetical protein BHAOGJBA_5957 [Methylobacterium hispanicum]